ncbi:MAG: hypothetical protein U0X91_27745 [Spirosomataceae bacterium]
MRSKRNISPTGGFNWGIYLYIAALGFLFFLKWSQDDFFPNSIKKSEPYFKRKDPKKLPPQIDWDKEKRKTGACTPHSNHLKWKDFNNRSYEMDWVVCREDYQLSAMKRSQANEYDQLIEHDARALEPILDAYRTLIEQEDLNAFEALNMVVTSVQHIEYTLVHPYSHETIQWQGGAFYRWYHQQCKRNPMEQIGGCIQNAATFGCLSPAEFAYHQMGDCDTRTTFLFLVLKRLGYDLLVIGGPYSAGSAHAILAVNTPYGQGKYYTFSGKRYYLFETTYFSNTVSPSSIGNFSPEIPYEQKNWEILLY